MNSIDHNLNDGRFDAAQLDREHHDHDIARPSDNRRRHAPRDGVHHAERVVYGHQHRHDHARALSTCSYETDQPLSLEALRELACRLPVNIYRCKGVIHSADAPERRAVLQVVGKRVDISLENEWGDRPPRTRIVAIGANGKFDGALLREQFAACVR